MPFLIPIIPIVASVVIGAGAAAAVVVPTVTSSVETVLPTPAQGDAATGSAGTAGSGGGVSATVDYGNR